MSCPLSNTRHAIKSTAATLNVRDFSYRQAHKRARIESCVPTAQQRHLLSATMRITLVKTILKILPYSRRGVSLATWDRRHAARATVSSYYEVASVASCATPGIKTISCSVDCAILMFVRIVVGIGFDPRLFFSRKREGERFCKLAGNISWLVRSLAAFY